jgi:hypothetical protein
VGAEGLTTGFAYAVEVSTVEVQLRCDASSDFFSDLVAMLLVGIDTERVVSLVSWSGPVESPAWRRHIVASRGDRPDLILPDHGSYLPGKIR